MKSSTSAAMSIAVFCATSGAFAQEAAPTYRPSVDPKVSFPSISSAWIPEGRFVAPAEILKVTPGKTKPQLYTLLGEPHYSNPLPLVTVWNYILDFYTGKGDEFIKCQYQIHFSGIPQRVKATYWKDAACQQYLEVAQVAGPAGPPGPPGPPGPAGPPAAAVRGTNDYVVYFPFDSAELTPEAKAVIADAAAYAATPPGSQGMVVGYTDASGTQPYNYKLSEQRAKAVAAALSADGVPTTTLAVSWKGKNDLAVPTADGVRMPLNRRVTIQVQPVH